VQRIDTRLDGPILLEPKVFGDDRGFFLESYRASVLADLGVHDEFVQDNHSRSRRGVVRGMHFAVGAGAASKIVRCARGAIVDVVVDLRRGSPTFGQWEAHALDDKSLRALYVPIGFGHGFCVVSEIADVVYKQSGYYDPRFEREVAYDDPDIGIEWPPDLELQPSARDREAPLLRDVADELEFDGAGA
jgi:dTDP-4-dehydrorhamnose 3,5-epimerase